GGGINFYFQIADTKNHRLAPADLKFFMKFLIEHQGRCAQINERQRFSQRPVRPYEIEFSKYAIVIEDKRNGSAPLWVEPFQRARKKDDNQQEDLSLYRPWLHSNESYTALAGSQLYGWKGTCLGGSPGVELGNVETRSGKQKRGSLLNPSTP